MSDICVVHLVRKRNGLEPFEKFLDSYLNYKAGIEHSLLIIYKGFNGKSDVAAYEKLLAGIPHTCLFLSDIGFDLRPYFIAARKSESKYLCYLNSFSAILADYWLLKLHTHIKKTGVGLVGATGSWGSIGPGPVSTQKTLPQWKKILRPLGWRLVALYFKIYFSPFPNPHVRTNGFMISNNNMRNIRHGLIFAKIHAFRLESGKNSITNQIKKMGLNVIVVGKDGLGFEENEWHASNTFWASTQSNLLIADNQTKRFETAASEIRSFLEHFTWGKNFDQYPDYESPPA